MFEILRRVLKRTLMIAYIIRSVDWVRYWKKKNSRSTNVVLVRACELHKIFGWLFSGAFENDLSLIDACARHLDDFRIKIGYKRTLTLKNQTIYHNLSKLYNSFEGRNQAESILNLQKLWLENGNTILPRQEDSRFWENKLYMHQRFAELQIPHPVTVIVDRANPAPAQPPMAFPFLFKPAHSSGSQGIIKIEDESQYRRVVGASPHEEYMLQELIDMRRDLRLIYIGSELVLHYWRINEGKEWRPTSTGHGSSVDFESLPEAWMDRIFQEYKKLNLVAGAFDITWRNDDLSTPPLFLEVSPSFMPNPGPSEMFRSRPYSEFKKQLWGKDAYYKKYIDLVFDFKLRLLEEYEKL
jgi:glutathione synthase/RimK-type ligase-like ATP-grasp enzyme